MRSVRGDGGGGDGVAPPTEATVIEKTALFITVVRFGKRVGAHVIGRAAVEVAALGRLTLQTATVLSANGGTAPSESVAIALLSPGDTVGVKPGAGFSVDRKVVGPPGCGGGGGDGDSG